MEDDVDALRAERDALRAEVEALNGPPRPPGRVRAAVVGALVLLSVLAVMVATLGVWAQRNALDTDRFVQRVAPLAENPQVQAVLARKMTDQIMTIVDPEALFAEALPERGQILAGPLTNAVEGFVHDQVLAFIQTDAFARLWRTTNEVAHRGIVRVLDGDHPRIETSEGQITLNLVPIINEVLARIGEASPDLLGRTVDLPTITVDEIPEAARAKLEEALGVSLDDDFGQITVYDDGKLAAVQTGVAIFEAIPVVSLACVVVAIPLALWLSRRRRRTLLQLLAGITIGLVVVRRLTLTVQEEVVDLARIEANQPALQAVTAVFLDPLLDATKWIIAGLLLAAVVTVVTGPYPWAVSLRLRVGRGAGAVWHALSAGVDEVGDDATVAWVRRHQDHLQFGGPIVVGLALWQLDVGWLGVLLLLAILGGFELAVHHIARPRPGEPDALDGGPQPDASTAGTG